MKIKDYGIEIFSMKYKKYGGHWHWFSKIFFDKIDALYFGFTLKEKRFGHWCFLWDGYQHTVWFWHFYVGWMGYPLKESDPKKFIF